ncbi:neuromedin-S isoform X4 [Pezoporus wallicus]|uniref:neuromedin-S isoform X4 n=1 Tax=Pezoporus wallicus TaxID=35540 RepID=UPI00254B3B31|nr:neuromedin-S isoform X4 [Pezoporus wallicus]XP_061315952.1 neuromedin-S isoform X4 [Pezoporus flaviventris]
MPDSDNLPRAGFSRSHRSGGAAAGAVRGAAPAPIGSAAARARRGPIKAAGRSVRPLGCSCPAMPSPPHVLPWLLAACCLCALPRGSGFPQPFSLSWDGADLPKSQISSTVLDLCYSIFNSMQTNEESQVAAAKFTKKDSHATLGRPFFLFRPRNGRTVESSEYHGI